MAGPQNGDKPIVYVVDDDPAIQEWVSRVLDGAKACIQTYPDAERFLAAYDDSRPGCLVLDIRMPGMDGLDLQDWLLSNDFEIPVIFLTGHGDIPSAVRAIRAGASHFLQKPVQAPVLVDCIREAIREDRERRLERTQSEVIQRRCERLTTREREILDLLVRGKSPKQIAMELGTSSDTVRKQRASILHKTEADSVVDLIRRIAHVRIDPPAGTGTRRPRHSKKIRTSDRQERR